MQAGLWQRSKIIHKAWFVHLKPTFRWLFSLEPFLYTYLIHTSYFRNSHLMRFLRQPKVKDMNNTVLILTETSCFQIDWVLVREVDASMLSILKIQQWMLQCTALTQQQVPALIFFRLFYIWLVCCCFQQMMSHISHWAQNLHYFMQLCNSYFTIFCNRD